MIIENLNIMYFLTKPGGREFVEQLSDTRANAM